MWILHSSRSRICWELGESSRDSDPTTFHFQFVFPARYTLLVLELFDMIIASSHPENDFHTSLVIAQRIEEKC